MKDSLTERISEYTGIGNGEMSNALADYAKRNIEAQAVARIFATGATRDNEHGKYDYEGFLSPLVLERYAEYMDKHRIQRDGTLRTSDNWQKGIPDDAYMKSLWRHFMDVWKAHRTGGEMEEALCAVLFNTMGLLYEIVRERELTP